MTTAENDMRGKPKFVAYFHFIDWNHVLNIGLHISIDQLHIEIHVPFGFFIIGWTDGWCHAPNNRDFGYGPHD